MCHTSMCSNFGWFIPQWTELLVSYLPTIDKDNLHWNWGQFSSKRVKKGPFNRFFDQFGNSVKTVFLKICSGSSTILQKTNKQTDNIPVMYSSVNVTHPQLQGFNYRSLCFPGLYVKLHPVPELAAGHEGICSHVTFSSSSAFIWQLWGLCAVL